jgi:hypothetical protein
VWEGWSCEASPYPDYLAQEGGIVDMRVGEKKPYLPVFVGSTFADLQLYRRAVRDALAQLEAIVRGMEHFGSKPGRPVG